MKKRIKRILIGVISFILVAILVVGFVFRKEIATVTSLKKNSEYPFYEMKYKADYGMKQFMKQGAATDQELTNLITKTVLKGLPIKANPDGACSTMHVTTPEGDSVFGRNFDYYPSVVMLVHTNPSDGYKAISMVNLTHIGMTKENLPDESLASRMKLLASPYIVLDGMNEKGLAVGVLVVDEQIVHQKTGKTPVTTTSALRMILDKAATVNEAIELLKSHDMNSSGSTGYHFQLADATGDTAVIEYINGEMKVVRSEKENNSLCATNFTLSTNEKNGSGQDRYEIIQKKLDETNGVMTEEETMRLLEEAHFDGVKASNADQTDKYYNAKTQWSAVYNLSKKTLTLCVGMDYDKKYEYSLEEIKE